MVSGRPSLFCFRSPFLHGIVVEPNALLSCRSTHNSQRPAFQEGNLAGMLMISRHGLADPCSIQDLHNVQSCRLHQSSSSFPTPLQLLHACLPLLLSPPSKRASRLETSTCFSILLDGSLYHYALPTVCRLHPSWRFKLRISILNGRFCNVA